MAQKRVVFLLRISASHGTSVYALIQRVHHWLIIINDVHTALIWLPGIWREVKWKYRCVAAEPLALTRSKFKSAKTPSHTRPAKPIRA